MALSKRPRNNNDDDDLNVGRGRSATFDNKLSHDRDALYKLGYYHRRIIGLAALPMPYFFFILKQKSCLSS